jgi:hypothetical protein
MGLEESKQEAETLTNDAVQMLQSLSCNTEFLQGLVIELLGRKL